MMRAIAIGILAAVICGCTPSVRDAQLAGLDLADSETLASLQMALPLDERAALGTYALLHWPKSKFYCGTPIGGGGSAARTVGEAIAQTQAYEIALSQQQIAARTALAVSAGAERQTLVTRMEQLVLERDMLRARIGPTADASPRGVAIDGELAAMRAELEEL